MLDNVIIIPYRAREEHLKYYLENTVPLLQKHMPNSKVVIIEQDWTNNLFNRGCLLNIGFNEYKDKTKYFMTHDIDINPYEQTILDYYVPPVPDNEFIGIFTFPNDSLGGIIKCKTETFLKTNGFPNDVWGWGAEDNALYFRARYFDMKVNLNEYNKRYENSNTSEAAKYFHIFNDIKDDNRINHGRNNQKYNFKLGNWSKEKQNTSIFNSGLNNLKYEILEKKYITDYVEIIKVNI